MKLNFTAELFRLVNECPDNFHDIIAIHLDIGMVDGTVKHFSCPFELLGEHMRVDAFDGFLTHIRDCEDTVSVEAGSIHFKSGAVLEHAANEFVTGICGLSGIWTYRKLADVHATPDIHSPEMTWFATVFPKEHAFWVAVDADDKAQQPVVDTVVKQEPDGTYSATFVLKGLSAANAKVAPGGIFAMLEQEYPQLKKGTVTTCELPSVREILGVTDESHRNTTVGCDKKETP